MTEQEIYDLLESLDYDEEQHLQALGERVETYDESLGVEQWQYTK